MVYSCFTFETEAAFGTALLLHHTVVAAKLLFTIFLESRKEKCVFWDRIWLPVVAARKLRCHIFKNKKICKPHKSFSNSTFSDSSCNYGKCILSINWSWIQIVLYWTSIKFLCQSEMSSNLCYRMISENCYMNIRVRSSETTITVS